MKKRTSKTRQKTRKPPAGESVEKLARRYGISARTLRRYRSAGCDIGDREQVARRWLALHPRDIATARRIAPEIARTSQGREAKRKNGVARRKAIAEMRIRESQARRSVEELASARLAVERERIKVAKLKRSMIPRRLAESAAEHATGILGGMLAKLARSLPPRLAGLDEARIQKTLAVDFRRLREEFCDHDFGAARDGTER
jgi:hypothetical protein